MYIITDQDGIIMHISPTLDHQKNGNPLIYDGTLAIVSSIVGTVSGDMPVPAGVEADKHTYIHGQFGENPNSREPQLQK